MSHLFYNEVTHWLFWNYVCRLRWYFRTGKEALPKYLLLKKKKKGGLLRQSGLKTAALNQEIAKLKNVDTVFVLINSVTNFCITA